MAIFPISRMSVTDLLKELDRCVLCASCLPYCPTFLLEGIEPESPRGRITLMQALLQEKITVDGANLTTLNHCLGCRGCESNCPSGVPYGKIRSHFRHWLSEQGREKVKQGPLKRWLGQPESQQKLATFTSLYQLSGMQRLVRNYEIVPERLRQLEGLLPESSVTTKVKPGYYPSPIESTGEKVTLFAGCISQTLDPIVIHDALKVCHQFGLSVTISSGNDCCGALAWQRGDIDAADRSLAEVQQAFAEEKPLLTLVDSCSARLQEGNKEGGESKPDPLSMRGQPMIDYLLQLPDDRWPQNMPDKQLKVGVHLSCSSKNLLKNSGNMQFLLRRLSGVTFFILEGYHCCGAAGEHMLEDIDHARQFLQPLMDQIESEKPDMIISSNLGCLAHLRRELLSHKEFNCRVVHPVSLLSQLFSSSSSTRKDGSR